MKLEKDDGKKGRRNRVKENYEREEEGGCNERTRVGLSAHVARSKNCIEDERAANKRLCNLRRGVFLTSFPTFFLWQKEPKASKKVWEGKGFLSQIGRKLP